MKNETKQLVKIITSTADKYGQSIDKILTEFVEATYQYVVTGAYSQDYAYLVTEHTEFITYLMESMKKRPYFDYFAEIMVELGKFDRKMGQCMTPPELVDIVTSLMLGEKQLEGKFCEFTCGTGSFVLKAIKSHITANNNTKSLELIINDLDNRLVKITVVQCLFNLLVNDFKELQKIQILAFQNNVLTEYLNSGYVVYDNNPDNIQEPYVQRFLAKKRFEEKLKSDSEEVLKNLSTSSKKAA
ncbi:hypothetical protein I6F48_00320 [Pseudoalteromonas sp. SWYJ118]|uniref:hypothetical protein n=1 Tax=Pseudoalteromonas sp. SWYJ118 TaxID=2792062 RepID=UPI0018CCF0D3|nr:hypothetical protein [Pseudoalteromonas sp. SWYJ118]MBH0074008.1 hypothetical protein [Pseudoalteromonas sp. SWYJ118]